MTRPRLAALWIGSFAFFFSFFMLMPTLPLYAQALGLGSGAIGVGSGAIGTLYTALELGIAIGGMAAGITVARVGYPTTFLAAGGIALGAAALAATRVRRA